LINSKRFSKNKDKKIFNRIWTVNPGPSRHPFDVNRHFDTSSWSQDRWEFLGDREREGVGAVSVREAEPTLVWTRRGLPSLLLHPLRMPPCPHFLQRLTFPPLRRQPVRP
jgi:hypothetical protein